MDQYTMAVDLVGYQHAAKPHGSIRTQQDKPGLTLNSRN